MPSTLSKWLIVFIAPALALAAPAPVSAPEDCKFSCPEVDADHRVLITTPYATAHNGFYFIFDCIYLSPHVTHTGTQICTYYKETGLNALSVEGSACPPQAVPCTADMVPLFSHEKDPEQKPWIGLGKWMLDMKENHHQ